MCVCVCGIAIAYCSSIRHYSILFVVCSSETHVEFSCIDVGRASIGTLFSSIIDDVQVTVRMTVLIVFCFR